MSEKTGNDTPDSGGTESPDTVEIHGGLLAFASSIILRLRHAITGHPIEMFSNGVTISWQDAEVEFGPDGRMRPDGVSIRCACGAYVYLRYTAKMKTTEHSCAYVYWRAVTPPERRCVWCGDLAK